MFHTQDPRKTILFYITNRHQLATVKVSPEGGLSMSISDSEIDFINRILEGEKGVCLNTDLSVTYISVVARDMKLKFGPQEDHILVIQEGIVSHHYNF